MARYVKIRDPEDYDNPIEIPTERNGSLSLSTIIGQFPGTVGLQYQVGPGIYLPCATTRGMVEPPIGGWGGIELVVMKDRTRFVRVRDVVGDPIEIPTERDGTLLLSTVVGQFPGTVGIKFQASTGAWRACSMTHGVIDPPFEGWDSVVLQVEKETPQFVRIRDGFGDPIEIPTERDGALLLSTVVGQFPGTVGLRYRVSTGLWRACTMSDGVIDPPFEGWAGMEFSVVKEMAGFAIIRETVGEPPIEVPTEQDGTLLLSSIAGQFPDAVGLQYQNSAGAWCVCTVIHGVIFPPADGWWNNEFFVVNQDVNTSSIPPTAKQRYNAVEQPNSKESKYIPRLRISNLPSETSEDEIHQYFAGFGEIELFNLVSKAGCGYIQYKTLASTNYVRQVCHNFKGRMLVVVLTKGSADHLNKERINASVVTKLQEYLFHHGDYTAGSTLIPDLMIANLPFIAEEAEIRSYFESFGEIEKFLMRYDNESKSRGFGFIKYKTLRATIHCLKTYHTLHNRSINVSPSNRAMEMLQFGYGIEWVPNDNIPTKLFVGRLPVNITEADLYRIFEDYSVKWVNLPKDGSCNYGFVTLTSVAEAYRAMNEPFLWNGKYLNVTAADESTCKPIAQQSKDKVNKSEQIQWMLDEIERLSQMSPEERMQVKHGSQQQNLMEQAPNTASYDNRYKHPGAASTSASRIFSSGNRADHGNQGFLSSKDGRRVEEVSDEEVDEEEDEDEDDDDEDDEDEVFRIQSHPRNSPYADLLSQFNKPNLWQLEGRPPVKTSALETTIVTIVDNEPMLLEMLSVLKRCGEFAIDFRKGSKRSNNPHRMIIQISSRTEDFLVDCQQLQKTQMMLLNEVCANPAILKVVNCCDIDRICTFATKCGIYMVNAFDVRVAEKHLKIKNPNPKPGVARLANILKGQCGIVISLVSHLVFPDRATPLSEASDVMVKALREGTHYLLYLHDVYRNRLVWEQKIVQVYDECALLCGGDTKEVLKPDTYKKNIRKSIMQQLKVAEQECFRLIHDWAWITAKEKGKSMRKVIRRKTMELIAKQMPRTLEDLKKCYTRKIPKVVVESCDIIFKLVGMAIGKYRDDEPRKMENPAQNYKPVAVDHDQPMGIRGSVNQGGLAESKSLTDRRESMDPRESTDHRGPLNHRESMDQKEIIDLTGSTEEWELLDHEKPMDHPGPMKLDGPTDYRRHAHHREHTYKRGPTEHRGPTYKRGPTDNRGPTDHRGPMDHRGSTDHRGPMDRREPMDHRGPFGHRGPTDHTRPTDNRGPMDYRTGMEHRGPLDHIGPNGSDRWHTDHSLLMCDDERGPIDPDRGSMMMIPDEGEAGRDRSPLGHNRGTMSHDSGKRDSIDQKVRRTRWEPEDLSDNTDSTCAPGITEKMRPSCRVAPNALMDRKGVKCLVGRIPRNKNSHNRDHQILGETKSSSINEIDIKSNQSCNIDASSDSEDVNERLYESNNPTRHLNVTDNQTIDVIKLESSPESSGRSRFINRGLNFLAAEAFGEVPKFQRRRSVPVVHVSNDKP